MQVIHDIGELRTAIAAARQVGQPIGLVPTMGYLHAGHLSLVELARRDGAFVVVTIFVNPTQFGPNEDYDRYPRDEAGDLRQCEQAGVDLVFMPATEVMYPPGSFTTVHIAQLTATLCGPHRPGHFDGVATIVSKLFNLVQPDRAYFGRKDAQQLAVLTQMTRDLNWPITIVPGETIREPDGLAMSSRNAMLSPDERQRARVLYHALCEGRDAIHAGERQSPALIASMRATIDAANPAAVDYIEVVDPQSMQPVESVAGPVLIALAVRFGGTRLIDNVLVDPASGGQ